MSSAVEREQLAGGRERGRTMAAPTLNVLGYCATLQLEALHLFLKPFFNGHGQPVTKSDEFYLSKN